MINIHYIYVNKHNKYDRSVPSELDGLKKKYAQIHQGHGKIRIYSYNDILEMLKNYDAEFAYYFELIDPIFAPAISDIGRVLCLYLKGGLYHDAHWYINDQDYFIKMNHLLSKDVVIFERHPKLRDCSFVIRNGNMAAGNSGSPILKNVLMRLKNNLRRMYEETHDNPEIRHCCWSEVGVFPIITELIDSNRCALEKGDFDQRDLHDLYKIASINNDLEEDDYKISSNEQEVLILHLNKYLEDISKFYNNGSKDHWSIYQKDRPILKLK